MLSNARFSDAGSYTVVVNNSLGAVTSAPPAVLTVMQPPETLIALGSSWRYLDDGSNQGTQWRTPGFDDSGWRSGMAQLGYGDGDEATVVGFGPVSTDKYITTYFRNSFVVANKSLITNLTVRLLRDDGAVGYLNGDELFRHNMPTGAITSATRASANIAGAAETVIHELPVNRALLVGGTNVVAVEIHQSGPTSADISFDLELAAGRAPAISLHADFVDRGRFRLWFDTPSASSYVIEASPDFDTWSPVSTNSVVNGQIEHIEVTPAVGQRFFRVREWP